MSSIVGTQQLAVVDRSSHEVPPVCHFPEVTTKAVQHFPLLATLGVTVAVRPDPLSIKVSSTEPCRVQRPQVALMLLPIGWLNLCNRSTVVEFPQRTPNDEAAHWQPTETPEYSSPLPVCHSTPVGLKVLCAYINIHTSWRPVQTNRQTTFFCLMYLFYIIFQLWNTERISTPGTSVRCWTLSRFCIWLSLF